MLFKGTDLENYLTEKCKEKCIAVEYISGDCCKKAIGCFDSVFPNFIRLVSNNDTCPFITITVFTRNNPPLQECAKEMIIMKNNIISVEIGPYYGDCYFGESEGNANKKALYKTKLDEQVENMVHDNEAEHGMVKNYKVEAEPEIMQNYIDEEEPETVQNYLDEAEPDIVQKHEEIEQEYLEGLDILQIKLGEQIPEPLPQDFFECDEIEDISLFEDLEDSEEE